MSAARDDASTALARFAPAGDLSTEVRRLVGRAADYARGARTRRTLAMYETEWRTFEGWCRERALPSFPAAPQVVATYLAWLADAGEKVATIERRLAAVSQWHAMHDEPTPRGAGCVSEVMKGIRRRLRTERPARRRAALLADDLVRMVATLPDDLEGKRDRALLLLGFAIAGRRSEIVGLKIDDLAWSDAGVRVSLRETKTNKEGEPDVVAVPRGERACPVTALRTWLDAAKIAEGCVFREVVAGYVVGRCLPDWRVDQVVRKGARILDLPNADRYGAHSLRAGFITSGVLAGRQEHALMRVSRHKNLNVFYNYVRAAPRFEDSPLRGLL